jgi:hypothetical protein
MDALVLVRVLNFGARRHTRSQVALFNLSTALHWSLMATFLTCCILLPIYLTVRFVAVGDALHTHKHHLLLQSGSPDVDPINYVRTVQWLHLMGTSTPNPTV